MTSRHKPSTNPLRLDPTRTQTLRRSFAAHVSRQFDALRSAVFDAVARRDVFGMGKRPDPSLAVTTNATELPPRHWDGKPDAEKIRLFTEWLREEAGVSVNSASAKKLWADYIKNGYVKGAGRAFDDAAPVDPLSPAEVRSAKKSGFLRSAFGNPVGVERLQVLVSRTFTELQNITQDMATRMTRVLADGLVQGKSPRAVASDLTKQLDVSKGRALTIARTEIVRAHADGQLQSLEALGVNELGVEVEWSTAGDGRTCPLCRPLKGKTFTLNQARGRLPRHPNCRCAWVPAIPKGLIGNVRRRLTATLNVFCPTGAGGGVDPHCRVGGKGPPSHANLNFVKGLGGSTGAKLMEDHQGNKFVVKSGKNAGHLRSEADADAAYRALGVPVPKSAIQETPDGPVKVAKFVDGKTLGSLTDPKDVAHVHAELRKHFVADALLGNWDVVGAGKDNVLLSPTGQVLRIDNGGALGYRAQGKEKDAPDWKNGSILSDIANLRNPSVNPQAAAVFGSLTEHEIRTQMYQVLGKKDQLLAAVKNEKDKFVLSERFHQIETELKKPAPVPPHVAAAIPTPATNFPSRFSDGQKLAGWLGKKPGWTPELSKKAAHLNPNGIADGKFVAPKKYTNAEKQSAFVQSFIDHLPPGMKVTSKNVTLKELGDPNAKTWKVGDKQTKISPPVPKTSGPINLPAQPTQTPPPPAPKPTLIKPDKPTFVSKNADQVKSNQKAVDEIEVLAELGDLAGVKSHPGTGSPKVKAYQDAVVAAMEKPKTGTKTPSKNPTPVTSPKPAPVLSDPPKPNHELADHPSVSYFGYDFTPAKHLPDSVEKDLVEVQSGGTHTLPNTDHYIDQTVHKDWTKSLTSEEQSAISDWKGNSGVIRAKMRKAATEKGSMEDAGVARHILTAMTKHPPQPGVYYRGLSGDGAAAVAKAALAAHGKGETFILDEAAHGMSPNPYMLNKFGGSVTGVGLRIVSKNARPIWKEDGFSDETNWGEKETLGPPMTKYRVKAIHTDVTVVGGGAGTKSKLKHLIELEEV